MSRWLVVTLVLSACAASPKAPSQLPLASAAQPEISTITVPIRATLAPLLPDLEAQVPKSISRTVRQNGLDITYSVIRRPIALSMVGTGLHATAAVEYSLQACRGNLPCVSCGIGESPRRADLALHSHLSWDQSWRIRSTTTPQPPFFPNRCTISFLQYDITDRLIAPVINDQLHAAAKAIDLSTPGLTNIRPTAEEIWSSLRVPYEIAPRTWLVFEPLDAGLAPLRGEGMNLGTALSVRARTRIVLGGRPAVAAAPLPPLLTRDAAGGISVAFDIHLPYDEATRLANERFGGRGYAIKRDTLRVRSIKVLPASGGRLAVEADVDYNGGRRKQYSGPVRLEGTPQIDQASQSVVVPDLDYALDRGHQTLFVRTAERFVHDELRAALAESAKYPLSKDTSAAQLEITSALHRSLATGVTLQGQADSIRAESVTAAPDAILVRVKVSGTAEVMVTSYR